MIAEITSGNEGKKIIILQKQSWMKFLRGQKYGLIWELSENTWQWDGCVFRE
jgi:hypothetical protein